MQILSGFALGLVVVSPVGPVTLLLVALGLERGRAVGVRGALGVVAADTAILVAVALLAARLRGIDGGVGAATELVLGVVLAVVGVHGLASRGGVAALARRVERPFPTMALVTLCNPMTAAVWLAVVLGATDAGIDGAGLALRVGGFALASLVWHLALGWGSGTLAGVIDDRRRLALQRLSAVVLLALATRLLFF